MQLNDAGILCYGLLYGILLLSRVNWKPTIILIIQCNS